MPEVSIRSTVVSTTTLIRIHHFSFRVEFQMFIPDASIEGVELLPNVPQPRMPIGVLSGSVVRELLESSGVNDYPLSRMFPDLIIPGDDFNASQFLVTMPLSLVPDLPSLHVGADPSTAKEILDGYPTVTRFPRSLTKWFREHGAQMLLKNNTPLRITYLPPYNFELIDGVLL